ncbi:hypothetical protein MTO96_005851 [Rhipicephalus appendiculatus]
MSRPGGDMTPEDVLVSLLICALAGACIAGLVGYGGGGGGYGGGGYGGGPWLRQVAAGAVLPDQDLAPR